MVMSISKDLLHGIIKGSSGLIKYQSKKETTKGERRSVVRLGFPFDVLDVGDFAAYGIGVFIHHLSMPVDILRVSA